MKALADPSRHAWDHWTAAVRLGQAGRAVEAARMRGRALSLFPAEENHDNALFLAAALNAADLPETAIDVVERAMGEAEAVGGASGYHALWARKVHVSATVNLRPRDEALAAIHGYLDLAETAGERGEGWRRGLLRGLSPHLRKVVAAQRRGSVGGEGCPA